MAVPSAAIFAVLRAAARAQEDRLLVGVASDRDRRRVTAALSAEGTVVETGSVRDALSRLEAESFELAVLDLDEGVPDALATAKERRPFTDLVALQIGDPGTCAVSFSAEVAAVLPRPLPDSDALLRAQLRWLVSCRRSRKRGLLLRNAIASQRSALTATEPALAVALADILDGADLEPTVLVLGDDGLLQDAGGRLVQASPDVVVLGCAAAERIEDRLLSARGRAAGAAVLVVDADPSPTRLQAALFGGARAYLDRAAVMPLGRIVAIAATRRRAETVGRRLLETLARFGVLDETAKATPVTARDVDAQLIAATSADSGAVVPSGHEVLVVDDELVVLTVLREALRRGGYSVTTATSAEEAIDLMRSRIFDLVLTDKNLPGASGLEVLRVARTLTPAPAVVLITGYTSYDSAVQALDIGAHDYIEKPISDLETLRFRIRRALSRRDEQLARKTEIPVSSRMPRILLVELEGSRRQLMAEFLGATYYVTVVANGDEALAKLGQEHFDVVLADRNLPGMSGLRVIEQARKLLPHCASVLYTAYPSYDTVKEAFDLGVDAFLIRPSEDLRALGDKIAGALRGRGGILLG